MSKLRSVAELSALRKLAGELAHERKERLSSVHLLAAVASGESAAASLLRDRRLDVDVLLKASRSFDDEGPDPMGRLLHAARDLAARTPDRTRGGVIEASALHLLLALLADRRAAAHRSLVHAGVDLAKLRAGAMQISLGIVQARRPTEPSRPVKLETAPAEASPRALREVARKSEPARPTRDARPSSLGPGVAVPLFPPRPMREPTPAPTPSATSMEVPRRAAALRSQPPASSPRQVAPPIRRAELELDKERFPTLAPLGHNLTLAAAEARLERVVGRDDEIDRALDVLGKRHASSVCFVGPPGVGKSALARGLAHRFAAAVRDDDVRLLIEVVLGELQTGVTRAAAAERWSRVCSEVRESKGKVLLFVDDLHELFAPGAMEEQVAELKLALARGELQLVGATTAEEYRRAVEIDTSLARRFTVVDVEEPSETDAFFLLQVVARDLGRHHGLAFSDEALAATVSWSTRYLPGRALPDKAIAILDFAGARAKRARAEGRGNEPIGTAEVAAVVADLADVPVERLLETDRERMLELEKHLAERVVGHAPALARIARVLRRNAAGLRGKRPIGTFLLLGPTGVGKTETAKAIAETLFHSPDAMTRLDFSEYSEPHAIARLVGAPPGYVGHESGGQLTEAVRRRPYQVVLLDEIEKAHRDVLEAFLQVFDEGRLTDGRGRRVDFTNTVIVLTSNLGASEVRALRAERPVGFAKAPVATSHGKLAETMLAAARAHLPPELYNRLDEVLCFEPLSRADVASIAARILEGLEDGLSVRGIKLDVDPKAIDALLDAGGFDAELGARPMKRAIGRLIENPLAELILKGDLVDGAVALVTVEKGEIVVDALPPEKRRVAVS